MLTKFIDLKSYWFTVHEHNSHKTYGIKGNQVMAPNMLANMLVKYASKEWLHMWHIRAFHFHTSNIFSSLNHRLVSFTTPGCLEIIWTFTTTGKVLFSNLWAGFKVWGKNWCPLWELLSPNVNEISRQPFHYFLSYYYLYASMWIQARDLYSPAASFWKPISRYMSIPWKLHLASTKGLVERKKNKKKTIFDNVTFLQSAIMSMCM